MNPWASLASDAPRVCREDYQLLQKFNSSARQEHWFDLSLYPEPYFGAQNAPIVLLTLNPGWSPQDAQTHARSDFGDLARAGLSHELQPFPFLHLQPHAQWPGAVWWRQRTRELVEATSFDLVAKQLACVQFIPYHSKEFAQNSPILPSQKYSFLLVRGAMLRRAEIIVMRSKVRWFQAIPELATYCRLHIARNPRAAYLSRKNLGVAWDPVLARLRSAA